MDELDLRIRNHLYASFAKSGNASAPVDVADALGLAEDDVAAAYGRLHDAHAVVLHPGTTEIRMLNPFSAVPTPHRVQADGRSWFANCAWDALGIPAALHHEAEVISRCEQTHEPLVLQVDEEGPEPSDFLFHCAVPAAQWWKDIVFT